MRRGFSLASYACRGLPNQLLQAQEVPPQNQSLILAPWSDSKNMVDENYRLEVTKPDKSKMSMNVLLQ
jgi:hypothetical protein